MSKTSKRPFTLFQRTSLGGKQVRKSLGTDDEQEAEQLAYQAWGEAHYRSKHGLQLEATAFSVVAEKFIEKMQAEAERGERSPYHKNDWPPIIRRYLIGFFGDRSVDGIRDADLERYLEWRKHYWSTGPGKDIPYIEYERDGKKLRRQPKRDVPSISRQRGELVAVRALFDQLARWGHVTPISGISIRANRRIDNRRPSFEPHEYAKLIQTSLDRLVDPIMLAGGPKEVTSSDGRAWKQVKIDDHTRRDRIALHCYVELAANTGMRPTETKNLNWGDILGYRDIINKPIGERDVRIRVRGKGKSGTLIPQLAAIPALDMLWQMFVKEVGREPRDDEPVFADPKGQRVLSFANGFRQLLKAADLEYDHRGVRRTPYSLRHFYVSQQLAHGVPIHDLARNTRTSIQMMDKHYAQVQVERMKDSLRPDWRN
ncbi:site-specific integrase [Aliihoeflea sp. 2WW]|uniref:tyrosine-type recombinase/integrase n=1 Tax=Aliihoeflea sp. 2WW TaxID=1381123 RepID=UPI000464914E|nr:site-specific integrase [Aliihoeflea sp. 2WW]